MWIYFFFFFFICATLYAWRRRRKEEWAQGMVGSRAYGRCGLYVSSKPRLTHSEGEKTEEVETGIVIVLSSMVAWATTEQKPGVSGRNGLVYH
jgi:hypothetical protein